MDILGFLLSVAAFITGLVFLVLASISFIKKDGKIKGRLIGIGASFAAFIVAFIIFIVNIDSPTTEVAEVEAEAEVTEEVQEESAKSKEEQEAEAEAKAEADAKEKAEAEAKAKAEAEAKAKAEEEARIAAEKEEAEKRANAAPIEYAQLIKNPDRYAGEYVKYRGQIVQIQEGDEYTVIRLSVTENSYGWDTNEIIWVEYDGYTEYVNEDIITVYGAIIGSHSYTSQAGWEITLPAMIATEFE